MNIVLKGIEEYPRYNENHIVGKFNKYLDNNFYRFVIMKSIQDPYKFRDFHKIIEEAIEWAQLCDYELPEKEELNDFKDLLYDFISTKSIMEDYRGTLLEQVIRFQGPDEFIGDYNPNNALEEVKVYCDRLEYENGGSDKNVDLTFFNDSIRQSHGVFSVNNFIACEVKCNINTFIYNIINAINKGKDLEKNSNYQKMMYLDDMSKKFNEEVCVTICSINHKNALTETFLKENNLDHIKIWNPLNNINLLRS